MTVLPLELLGDELAGQMDSLFLCFPFTNATVFQGRISTQAQS